MDRFGSALSRSPGIGVLSLKGDGVDAPDGIYVPR
jgi:hypothetical protein